MALKINNNKIILKFLKSIVPQTIDSLKVQNGDFVTYKYFDYFQKNGFNIIANHFYQPIPDLTQINWSRIRESDLVGVKMNESAQLNLMKDEFSKYRKEFRLFKKISSKVDTQNDPMYYFNNMAFDGVDGLVYYSLIRSRKPKQIIEIGSGWSTKIAAQASLINKNTKLYSVEPYPQPILEKGFPGLTGLIKKRVEDLPHTFFKKLESGDFLFIDSSHTVKTGGDVNYLVLEVLPRLNKGVYIHFHDIFLPREYPKEWIVKEQRFWAEQYLLHAFLLFSDSFEVIYANNFMGIKHQKDVRNVFGKATDKIYGGSFWIRKVK